MRALTLAVLLVSGVAFAEPQTIYYVDSPTVLAGKGGMIELPPGYFLPEAAFLAVDTEMRRLQFTETKLTAENKVLREHAENVPVLAIVIAGAVGIAAGGAAVYFLVPR